MANKRKIDIQLAVEMIRAGVPYRAAAEHFGATENSLRVTLHRAKATPKRKTVAEFFSEKGAHHEAH